MKTVSSLLFPAICYLCFSCSSGEDNKEHGQQADTMLVTVKDNIDSAFKLKQHSHNNSSDTDIVFSVRITAAKEIDTVLFSKPVLAGMSANGNLLYSKDTIRSSKNFYGNVLLNFDPGDSSHCFSLKCDSFIEIKNTELNLNFPEYFFSGNTALITRNEKIVTQHWYMDTRQRGMTATDSVKIIGKGQTITGYALQLEDLYFYNWRLNYIKGVYPLSP